MHVLASGSFADSQSMACEGELFLIGAINRQDCYDTSRLIEGKDDEL